MVDNKWIRAYTNSMDSEIKELEMNLYKFVGGELVDPMVPESLVEFDYEIFARDLPSAVDLFYTIFPSCTIVRFSSEYAQRLKS